MAVLQVFSGFLIEYLYFFVCYYTVMCIAAFAFYAADKAKAKNGEWRISETILLTLSFIGGSAGALLAMHMMRHKTHNFKFIICVPLSLILHIAAAAVVVYFGLYK